jgi:hypothetical protein
MAVSEVIGRFQAIESFAIRAREEFYIIGQLLEGRVQAHWFVNIQCNPSFAITVRIKQVELVEIASETAAYLLLILSAAAEDIDLLLGLNIGNELMRITEEGED